MWEIEKPDWISPPLEPFLTILDWSPVPKFLENDEFLAGANIAFPKNLLSTFNGFQVGLDRVGTKLISNGEISLLNQIKEAGYKVYYHPLISVQHLVPISRMKISWFKSRFFWQGYSDAVMGLYNDNPSLFSRSKQLIILSCQLLWNFLSDKKSTDKLYSKLMNHYKLGKMRGLCAKIK